MKKALFILFLFSGISFAGMDCLNIGLIFDNSVNRNIVYDWAIEKSSITTWKGQEEIETYEITYGTPAVTGYGIRIILRTDFKKPSYYDAIKTKWNWVKNNMGGTILRASVVYHLCDNDETVKNRSGCKTKYLYTKDIIP